MPHIIILKNNFVQTLVIITKKLKNLLKPNFYRPPKFRRSHPHNLSPLRSHKSLLLKFNFTQRQRWRAIKEKSQQVHNQIHLIVYQVGFWNSELGFLVLLEQNSSKRNVFHKKILTKNNLKYKIYNENFFTNNCFLIINVILLIKEASPGVGTIGSDWIGKIDPIRPHFFAKATNPIWSNFFEKATNPIRSKNFREGHGSDPIFSETHQIA